MHRRDNDKAQGSAGQRATETYLAVRALTERITSCLSPEDQQLQSMPLCSPVKWHRAHTTWFFETFILERRGARPVDGRFGFLFNSYYNAVGPRQAREKRGLLSRPTCEEVAAYRRVVDGRMLELLAGASDGELAELRPLLAVGLSHEQQHQELILTDILNALHENPMRPAYRPAPPQAGEPAAGEPRPMEYCLFPGGLVHIGIDAHSGGFAFDNESPRHQVWLEPYRLATRLVTVGEMRGFIEAGGYRTASLWLSDGYDFVRAQGIEAPLYWERDGSGWAVFSLEGLRRPGDDEPVCNVSYYEADAVARFLGARLPSEQEWEAAARTLSPQGNFLESGALRALPDPGHAERIGQLFGDAWEWTGSSYEPYPGFRAAPGALGEYNGKFMVNQRVLRGGSCFTPAGHIRTTYRNFWHPDTRFQMTGIRLAKDA
jgi:ergothioneine biosynthesis protein EgtB